MEFLKKRFVDNDSLVSKANDFVPRNHFGYVAPLFVAYFLAFFFSTMMTFLFEGNPILISGVFLFFFGAACIINSVYLRRFNEINNAIEFQNSIYSAALRGDCAYCLIFNDEGEVVYADPRLQKLTTTKVFKNLTELEILLNTFGVSPEKAQQIHDMVFRNKYPQLIDEEHKPSSRDDRMILLKPFHMEEGDFAISVWNMERPLGFTTLKISKIDEEQETSQIVEDIAVGFYELDSMGHLSKINEYFARMLGYSKSELINLDMKLEALVDKEESMDALIPSPGMENALMGNWQGFLTMRTKFKEHTNVFVIQKAFFKPNGQIERTVGYVIKLQDDSLVVKSRGVERGWIDYSWKCFFENSPYPVAILDKSGLILKINQSFVDILPGEFLNKKFYDMFIASDREVIAEQIEIIISRNTQPRPIKGMKIEGNNRILDIYLGKILDLNGETYGFMVRIADMTQQLELESSLSHAQRMQTIGHLVGSVAHDFNNLLTAILGFCDLLLLSHPVGDPSFAHINQIKQSSERASNLVQRLLAFSRKQTLKPQVVNLGELLSDFSSVIQRLIGTEVNYHKLIDSNVWYVKIDPVQMEQVILNLTVNASHAMVNGGELSIKLKNVVLQNNDGELADFIAPSGEGLPPAGEYVCMEVSDTGEGIPKEIVMKIFEPFFTTKAEKSGTGLGLSTVYGIVRQSEGFIYLQTELGKGTTFYIYLKRHNLSADEKMKIESLEDEAVKEDKENKADFTGRGVIALVEDEDAVRLFAKSVLTSKGYDVIEYSSAKAALGTIEAELPRINLIISDVMMPEMTGPAFIKEVKKIRPDIKVIFISGYGEEAFEEEYGDSRDFHFIPKPFKLKQLVSKVKEVLGSVN
jgi:two-component system cell cycle sensor histidine kinase/response regulator CckA